MANDSFGFLKGKWARISATFGGQGSEIHMRIEDETEDTLLGLDGKGARIVLAKRCVEAAYESAKGTTETRIERGIDKAASKLRERRKQARP